MAAWDGRLEGVISDGELDPILLAEWWTSFEDATLDSIMDRAIQANLNLRTARAQLRAARAQRLVADGANGPTANVSGSGTRSGNEAATGELYSVGLDASWEIDLFGGKQRGNEAADADLQAAEEARRDVLVSVLAEVALNYSDLRTLQERKSLTEQSLTAFVEQQEIVQAKFDAGETSRLDLDQADSNVAKVRASLPSFQQQISQIQNRLALLCGLAPGSLNDQLDQWLPLKLPNVAVAIGVPAEVLRRRPDVRRAERLLAAETARVGVAKADLYPSLSLGGSIGLQSNASSSLFDTISQLWSFGPRVSWNLYDGGQARQRIEVQDAVQEQALIAYEEVILKSLEEVQNAATSYGLEQIRFASLEQASISAGRASDLAQTRYLAGDSEFLNVLDAQRTAISSADERAQSRGKIIGDLIRLYKSLGGGWESVAPLSEDAE
ncbi:MAG: NodT family efflux transporter outer membrane factor (OMF) lipoprotein [Planctomycetota bacterium]|jgi:NodT family efflux transporter outer membrane factor (OMF) lipoprotein